MRRGLLKVEQLHALARAVYYGQRGRISAREVYDQVNACSCRRGYVQIITEYSDDQTFNQRPRLKRVLNPFRVRVDPSAEEPDQRDAEYAFLETDYDADTWKDEFGGPGKELPTKDGTDWTGADNTYREP